MRLPIRVYWEDTDASGVVYHANYLRYFERARSEWVRAQGLDQEKLRTDHGLAFTIAGIDVTFLKPARLDDELIATAELAERKRASLSFRQSLSRGDTLLTTAQARIACVDWRTFKPRPLPEFP